MPHPLLVGWILKQASVFNLYAAAKAYGFHRVYRRLLEANKRLVSSRDDRKIVQATIKDAMRFPTKVVDVLEESHTVAFLQSYAKELASGLEKSAPPFFVSAAKIILTKTPVARMFDIFDDWRGARKAKGQGNGKGDEPTGGPGSEGPVPATRKGGPSKG